MSRRIVAGIISIVIFCSGANAATVSPIEGSTSLNKGDGFRPLTQATPAKAGDRVITGGNGRAQIAYDNGCVVTLEANQSVAVATDPVCQQAVPADYTALLVGGAVAGGVGLAIALTSGDSKKRPASP